MHLNIIAVDDNETNLNVIEEMFDILDQKIISFVNPYEALDYAKHNNIDIAIVDYMMPEMDGISLVQELLKIQPEMINIMVTAIGDDRDLKIKALENGVVDFLSKPIDIMEFQIKIRNLSRMKESQNTVRDFNKILQKEVSEATDVIVEQEYETLKILSSVAEYRDPETSAHINRVANYSKLLAKACGLSEEEQTVILYASPLHDIGKIGIPDDILLKPAKLTDEEFKVMKAHPLIGYEILKNTKNNFLRAGAIISKTHHEKYDGSGYPMGLKGEEIPMYGRITAIADVFDALTSSRPYKKAWSFDDAIDFIKKEREKHFDPRLVDLFIENIEEVLNIYKFYTEEGH